MVTGIPAAPVRTPDRDSRLQKAAQEFEAVLLKDFLRLGSFDEEQGDGDCCLEGYQDLRNEAVASAMAAQGGVGIARTFLAGMHEALRPEQD